MAPRTVLISVWLVLVAAAMPARADLDRRSTPACDNALLSTLSKAKLRIVRNEVYARRGRPFTSADLQQHFAQYEWYVPDNAYSDARLDADDKACVRRVQRWEKVAGVLWKTTADLDGDGKDEPIFFAVSDRAALDKARDRQLRPPVPAWLFVGDLVHALSWIWPEGAYWTSQLGERFEVVDLDERKPGRHIWVRQHLGQMEDPGIDNHLVTVRGGKLVVTQLAASDYNAGRIKLLGEGRAVMVKSTCPPHKVWYTLRKGALVKTAEEKKPPPDGFCAACPFVDVLADGGFIEQGEILRYLNDPILDGWQRLPIEVPAGSTQVTVRLREAKDEDTFVDAAALVMGAHRVSPSRCATEGTLCDRDRAYLRLAPGQERVLTFMLPEPAEGPVFVEVAGHYIPR